MMTTGCRASVGNGASGGQGSVKNSGSSNAAGRDRAALFMASDKARASCRWNLAQVTQTCGARARHASRRVCSASTSPL
jgi:hypothetical protein